MNRYAPRHESCPLPDETPPREKWTIWSSVVAIFAGALVAYMIIKFIGW